jgi:demethylmenaquinone methyltransferase/2-methoxy-6-polyprenyl-1,4-benzoquinol methylase
MALNKNQVRDLYRRRAEHYDFSANLYYLVGFSETRYRKKAVAALGLNPGDTVVEIGCGTGLSFPHLREAVGETGKIIGVDLTDAMLERATERVRRHQWSNVELVQTDAALYSFPPEVKGVLSTFALTLIPEYEEIIKRASQALAPSGRLVVADLKQPDGWPLWGIKVAVLLTKPFGVSLDLAERKPWEIMKRYFSKVTVTEGFGGMVYIAVGENASQAP